VPALETTTTTPIVFSPLLRQYTLAESWTLPDPENRSHYELIGGCLFMVPPPDPPDGDFDDRLNMSLVGFLTARGKPGRVYHPREPIYTDNTYLEPDMIYVSNELAARTARRRTSADIVFEYASRSSGTYDPTTKADTYLALGVGELWLIDAGTITIEVRWAAVKADSLAWNTRRYGKGELAESRVLEGWRVSVDELFAGLTED
jgi:Uma2 family endonuclease